MSGLSSESVVTVSPEEEHSTILSILEKNGATPADARTQACMLVEGDLRGHHSHGIRRIPILAERLRKGVTTSGVEPVVTWDGPARMHVDGKDGLGPVVLKRAMELLLPAAASSGIAIASIAKSGHIGMLAPYVERIANEGFIGVLLTTSEALVAPWGGSRAMLGTNPVGIGIPSAGEPFVLDMSTGAVSAGKVLDFAARGREIPLGWAVDAHGKQTTDPDAAAEGAIAPFGGAKGYALGLAFESIVGLLSQTSLGRDVHGTLDVDLHSTKGDVLIAAPIVDGPSTLEPLTRFFEELRAEGSGDEPVLIPGDRARQLRKERLRGGIPLDRDLWNQVLQLAAP